MFFKPLDDHHYMFYADLLQMATVELPLLGVLLDRLGRGPLSSSTVCLSTGPLLQSQDSRGEDGGEAWGAQCPGPNSDTASLARLFVREAKGLL